MRKRRIAITSFAIFAALISLTDAFRGNLEVVLVLITERCIEKD